MYKDATRYHGYRFPPEIIGHAVWLYHRFCLSFRDVEDLLAERGILVSCETIRQWCRKFGPAFARRLKRRQGCLGDTWHLDELFVSIRGQQHYLWRAVDQDGDVIDIFVQPQRDERSCLPLSTTPADTRTIEQRFPTRRPDSGSDKCEGSSPLLKPSDSCRCTDSPRTSSVSDDTCCGQPTSGCCGLVRFWSGTRSRVPDDCRGRRLMRRTAL